MPDQTTFGDTAASAAQTTFGDTVVKPTSVPFGAVPPGTQETPFGGSTNPSAFQQAVELFDPISQGMTFGFSDEITAPVTALITGESREEALQRTRERSERIREEQPLASIAAEVAGGLAVGAPIAAAGGAIPLVSRLPAAARFGLGGAAAGGTAGAGTSEEGRRLEGAVEGAAIGGALGVTLPVAGRAAAAALTPLFNRVQGVTRTAIGRIQQALQRDDMTVEQAREELQRLGVNATISDVGGENVRGLAQAVQALPGRGRAAIRDALETRQAGQVQRIADSINESLGKGGEFRMTREALAQARREAAAPLYEGAYEIGIPATDELVQLFSRPSIRRGLDRARQIAEEEGDRFPNILDADGNLLAGEARAVPTRVFDYLQRALADTVEGDRNQLTGAVTTQIGRAVDKTRRDLLELVDRENPIFAAARGVYAGDSASISALEQGRRLGRGLSRQSDEFDPEQIYDDLDKMTDSEQAFFRQGLARGLIDAVEATSDTANAVRRIVGTEARRGRLRAAFPDGETFTRFMSDMAREFRFFQTRADVLLGSPTAPRQQAIADLTGRTGTPFLEGGVAATVGRGVTAANRRLRSASPAAIEEIGNMLFAQGPDATRLIDLIGRTPSIPPALQRGGLAALVEAERQGGSFPNR